MLRSFSVEGFKVFRSAHIEGLCQLNLFVGKNNIGKSCLLEAIRLWNANAHPAVLRDLVHSRDGDWERDISRRDVREDIGRGSDPEDPIRFLFNDFEYQNLSDAQIRLGCGSPEDTVRVSLGKYIRVREEDGTVRRVRVDTQLELLENAPEAEYMIEIAIGAKRRTVYPLDSLWRRNVARPASLDEIPSRATTVVGTHGLSNEEAAYLWDQVSLTPQQERVLQCLRLIEPAIEGLTLVGEPRSYSDRHRIPVISLRGRRGRFPLKTMGDGLTRLFHIALSIVNAQDGTVLIDEFENGLYWETQQELWPVIFEVAAQFNVQVFATSHSNDCLSSFVSASAKHHGSGALFRIETKDANLRAVALPIANVEDALASQVEIR